MRSADEEEAMMLEGKVVIVTGGARGIGAAIVRLFADEGARVWFSARSEQPGRDLERELTAAGRDVVFRPGNCAIEADARVLVGETTGRCGRLDVLVNNAASSHLGPVESFPLAAWEEVIANNVTSMFLMSKEAIPHLKRAKGNIVNLGSTFAFVGAEGSAAYALTKAAAVSFTKTLALELARDGVRVNALCPGATETPLYDAWVRTQPDAAQARVDLIALHPLGRLGSPQDMADAALFLASDRAAFVTGHALLVDGGYTAR
jgi:NAD(P)-dependent dehydrogenase (short-subunit alcohol dehydrogenase family)